MTNLKLFSSLLLLITTGCMTSPKNSPSLTQNHRAPSAVSATESTPLANIDSQWDVVDHKYFKVYYDRTNRLPRFSIYTLTADHLRVTPIKRPNSFRADPLLVSQGIPYVQPSEYKSSGYDRGHMAPYEDFAYSAESGNETFVMSNMCPQSKMLNEQSWKNLEEQVRKWGCGEERVIVITGPVIEEGLTTLKSGLPVPNQFFKIVIDDTPPRKAVGFVYNQIDGKAVKFPSRVAKVTDIEDVILENFESLVPPEDVGIFSAAPNLGDWKSADCRSKRANDSVSSPALAQ